MIGVHTCKAHGVSLAVKKKKKSAIVILLLTSVVTKEDFKKSVMIIINTKTKLPHPKKLLIYTLGGFNFPYII